MTGFLLGLLIGGSAGFVFGMGVLAMVVAARRADEDEARAAGGPLRGGSL